MTWYYQVPKEVFSGAITVHGNIFIGDTNEQQKNITCGCETCITTMSLQPDLNKWRISQLYKPDKWYNNSASTRLLETFKNDFIV